MADPSVRDTEDVRAELVACVQYAVHELVTVITTVATSATRYSGNLDNPW